MGRKPSSINSKKDHKLTRRRVMKYALAAGFPAATAAVLTPEDVKAADSDQVTIPIDTEGNYKKQVQRDVYDQYIHARRINERVKNRHFGKSGIIGIGLKPGGDVSEPSVVVTLDEDNSEKDERRGEFPERREGVPIEFREESKEDRQLLCDPEKGDKYNLVGGLKSEVGIPTEEHTHGSRFITGSDHQFYFGWSTAAHSMDVNSITGSCESVTTVYHHDDHYGELIYWDHDRDIAYIEPSPHWHDPVSEVVHPEHHDTALEVHGTVSEDAMATVVIEDMLQTHFYGIGSCHNTGIVGRMNETVQLVEGEYQCNSSNRLIDQLIYEVGCDPLLPGDSGSVPIVEDPGSGDNFAVGSVSGRESPTVCENRAWGPQGFSIRDVHNMWWDNL